MNQNNSKDGSSEYEINTSWYAKCGEGEDVILSTKALLVRNLADFPFPVKMSTSDKEAVNSIIYDIIKDKDEFYFMNYADIPDKALLLLKYKGVLPENTDSAKDTTSVILHEDDCTSLLVNHIDHLRISSYSAGLDSEKVMAKVYKIDELFQEKVQFAASHDFGYLTSKINNCGTGLKISARIFIPGIMLTNYYEEFSRDLLKKQYILKPVYKETNTPDFDTAFFDVFSAQSFYGTELDQMAGIQSIGQYILKTERKIRKNFADNNPTMLLNFVKTAYAEVMYSLLLTYIDGVNLISAIKWGLENNLIEGITESEINALYYRTKSGYLLCLCDKNQFPFEDDIKKDVQKQILRLRAIVIQQAFINLKIKK